MRGLMAFATSDAGRAYANVCRIWGTDPGAPLADDVLAYNLRAIFALAMPEPAEETTTTDVDEAWAKAGAENMRQWESMQ